MTDVVPEISIVIAWQKSQLDATACLDSLFNQKTFHRFEVILIYGGFNPNLDAFTQRYPKVKIAAHPDSSSIPKLHGLGIEMSSAPLIAITEAHTTFAQNWIDTAILVSAENDAAATGGVVDPGPALTGVDFALYLCDYVQFARPLESEVSDDLPGNNIVFKRSAIQHLLAQKDLRSDGFWKTFFCYELMKEGKVLRRDSRLVAYYNRHLSFVDVLTRRYNHGRCFGAMRSSDFSFSKKAGYATACIALPPVLHARLFQRIKTKRHLLNRYFMVQAVCHSIIQAWVVGEYAGTVSGAGESCSEL
ncbi:MAG TPA: hypothetical protein V6C76_05725 [Drouetiella sp.]